MKILVLSAYHAPSHRRWLQGLIDNLPQHNFRVLTQPPRHFPWRSRGSSLAWAFDDELPRIDADLLVTTSMVDLAGLRGMVPQLSRLPTLVYYHENQFAYPTRDGKVNANLLVTNLYTALSADRILFNSRYNRRSFLDGIDEFLSGMPDQIPDGVSERVAADSDVIAVPLEDELFEYDSLPTRSEGPDAPLRILWNHRWEFDKAPERFFGALFELQNRVDFRLVVLGQQFREAPPIFKQARERLKGRLDHWGWVEDRQDYLSWLRRSDIAVSTAIHEFQGLAVQEAVVAGCLPVLPDRLAYPNFFDDAYLYDSHLDCAESDRAALVDHLEPLLADPAAARAVDRPDLSPLRWSLLSHSYEAEFKRLATHRARQPAY